MRRSDDIVNGQDPVVPTIFVRRNALFCKLLKCQGHPMTSVFSKPTCLILAACLAVSASLARAETPAAPSTAFQMAVAEKVSTLPNLAAFYRETAFQPVWVGDTEQHAARRAALIEALSATKVHGLPEARYDVQTILDKMDQVGSVRDLGLVEAELSRLFLKYADDVQSGILRPSDIDAGLVRQVERQTASDHLGALVASDDGDYIRDLAPASLQYIALLKQKLVLENLMAAGGWGPGGAGQQAGIRRQRTKCHKAAQPVGSHGLYGADRQPHI